MYLVTAIHPDHAFFHVEKKILILQMQKYIEISTNV